MQLEWGTVLALLAVALQLTLVWGFDYFPTVDGPAHVHLAYGLYEALTGNHFYKEFLEINHTFNPNNLIQGILVSLMAIASPFIAEKILLSLYFVGFSAGSVYMLSGINRNSLCLLPFLMFCGISFSLAFGFYNFSFGTIVFLGWFGFWWRHRASVKNSVILGHASFAAVAYLTHIFAFIVTLFAIVATSAGIALLKLSHHKGDGTGPAYTWQGLFRSHILPPLLGSIPELIAAAAFLFLRFGAHTSAGAANLSTLKLHRLMDLFFASSLTPYSFAENVAASAFVLSVCLILYGLLRRGGSVKASVPLAICFFAFLVLYVGMPFQWIVRWMPERFQPFVFLTLLLWMAMLMPAVTSRLYQNLVATLGIAILCVSVIGRAGAFADINNYYREYASAAPHIAENSTLIGLRLNWKSQGKPFPAETPVFIQLGSRMATLRHAVDLKNFQGQARGHPIQFRPGMNATLALGGNFAITAIPPRVNLLAYEQKTGRPIDYVLIWGDRNEVEDKEALDSLFAQLDKCYSVVFVSKPRELLTLYKRD